MVELCNKKMFEFNYLMNNLQKVVLSSCKWLTCSRSLHRDHLSEGGRGGSTRTLQVQCECCIQLAAVFHIRHSPYLSQGEHRILDNTLVWGADDPSSCRVVKFDSCNNLWSSVLHAVLVIISTVFCQFVINRRLLLLLLLFSLFVASSG